MSGEMSTIQSLKAVDAWIDVINANINGGVRTGFKSARLKFSGTNVDLQRAGSSTNLPLQFPESGLQTANTVIDFSQGAITASTEDTHVALQGEGFFVLSDSPAQDGHVYFTRDGEFHWKDGFLVNNDGLYVLGAGNVSAQTAANPAPSSGWVGAGTGWDGSGTTMWYPGGSFGAHPIGSAADPILFRKAFTVTGSAPVTITISTGEDACAKFFLDGVNITINGGPYTGYDYVQSNRVYTFTLAPGAHVMTVQAFDDNMNTAHVKIQTTAGPAMLDTPAGWQAFPALSQATPGWDQPYDIVTQASAAASGALDPSLIGVGIVTSKQQLQFTKFGSTVFELPQGSPATPMGAPGTGGRGTVLSKSLEASNASMTQSVPELSLAQKLFSALTKVLQTKQTNVDGILNLIR